jgi:DNA-binding MarR family transcriptional regulator
MPYKFRRHKPAPMTDAPVPCHCFRLRAAARRATLFYDRRLEPLDLRITQYSLLARIRAAGSIPLKDLAARQAMDRTTLSRTLAPLVGRGLVALVPGPDRRTRGAVLTRRGLFLLRQARGLWRKAQAEFEAALGRGATARLLDALDETEAGLDRRARGRRAAPAERPAPSGHASGVAGRA